MDEERGGEDPLFQTDNFRIYEYKASPTLCHFLWGKADR